MPFAFLLAMQAAGMIVNYIGTQNQENYMKMGMEMQQRMIDQSIQQTKLQAEDESLQALKQLRQNMGTQLAIFASRGTNPGAGSAFTLLNQNISNFNADERTRRINLLGRINELKAGKTISMLNHSGEVSKLWQGFASNTMQNIGTSASAYGKAGSFFGNVK